MGLVESKLFCKPTGRTRGAEYRVSWEYDVTKQSSRGPGAGVCEHLSDAYQYCSDHLAVFKAG